MRMLHDKLKAQVSKPVMCFGIFLLCKIGFLFHKRLHHTITVLLVDYVDLFKSSFGKRLQVKNNICRYEHSEFKSEIGMTREARQYERTMTCFL